MEKLIQQMLETKTPDRFRPDLWMWLTPLALAAIVVSSSFYSVLLFHTLVEFFAITVAILMCVVAWHTHQFTRNNFLMYLGCGYFWVATLDMCHTLVYRGMTIFPQIDSANASTQLWIGTRFLEAFLLLSSPYFLAHDLNRKLAFAGFGLVAVGIFTSVMTGMFPETFIEGKGLTPFKVNSEYLIIALLGLSMGYLFAERRHLKQRMIYVMFASIGLTMLSELAFTFYISAYGISNQVGHIFKLFSFWLIFVAVVRTTLKEPFALMAQGATTYDAVPVATIVVDENNTIRQVNRRACELAELDKTELVGKNAHTVFHSQRDHERDCRVCQHALSGIALDTKELEIPDKHRWYDFSLSPISIGGGVRGMVQVVRDITQHKHQDEELRQHRHNLEALVEERTRELAVARDQAVLGTQAKSTFIANMSHELRTPLNSIIGFTGIIKSGMAGPVNAVQLSQLERVYASSRHLLGLINDILDLSKVEAGKMPVVLTEFHVGALFKDLKMQIDFLFQEKEIELRMPQFNGGPFMSSDRVKVYQVLLNLLSNALKFTEKGNVSLEYRVQNRDILFSVRDTGIGISEENLSKVFETFHQGSNAGHIPQGGTGLGLTISRGLVDLLGGEISVQSEKGAGSLFTVSFANCVVTQTEEKSQFEEVQV